MTFRSICALALLASLATCATSAQAADFKYDVRITGKYAYDIQSTAKWTPDNDCGNKEKASLDYTVKFETADLDGQRIRLKPHGKNGVEIVEGDEHKLKVNEVSIYDEKNSVSDQRCTPAPNLPSKCAKQYRTRLDLLSNMKRGGFSPDKKLKDANGFLTFGNVGNAAISNSCFKFVSIFADDVPFEPFLPWTSEKRFNDRLLQLKRGKSAALEFSMLPHVLTGNTCRGAKDPCDKAGEWERTYAIHWLAEFVRR